MLYNLLAKIKIKLQALNITTFIELSSLNIFLNEKKERREQKKKESGEWMKVHIEQQVSVKEGMKDK